MTITIQKRPAMRDRLPYGKWTCEDGREVLFNRQYRPIWQRRPSEPATIADPTERVKFMREEWFYRDASAPCRNKASRARCEAVLTAWGV
jgi:hypothetical protein